MRETFSRAVDFQRFDARSNVWVSIDCPRAVAETYLEREGKWQLPVLTRIITAPTIRPDRSVLEQPGYDEATGLLFEPQGVAFSPVPASPGFFDDVIPPGNTLLELLKTFPFVDQPSRAVALSAILTSLIRPSLPSAPLHAFTAPIRAASGAAIGAAAGGGPGAALGAAIGGANRDSWGSRYYTFAPAGHLLQLRSARVPPVHYLDKLPQPSLGATSLNPGGPVLNVEEGPVPDVG